MKSEKLKVKSDYSFSKHEKIKILGIESSPRKNSNSNHLLSYFLQVAKENSFQTKKINIYDFKISPCNACGFCEKKGLCNIKDEADLIFKEILKADILVISSPVYFASIPAHLKSLIDRAQAYWIKKYKLDKKNNINQKLSFLLLVAGSKNKISAYEGIKLTMEYFFDSLNFKFQKTLFYEGYDKEGSILKNKNFQNDIKKIFNE